ncbi:MAG: hypothetical protein TREMPRED_003853 [Tremellales sp. Tagirdzhanova-0007]|nr:MAG: hypothetical protein TREMPRED_003853 [Tremellales sp. Tagirdzhanova-0007]
MSHSKAQDPYDGSTVQTRIPTASIGSQLATWHANRGDKSIARAVIPSWQTESHGEKTTKNPFKLFAMVSPFGWAMFFSGWFAWTCDGYDYFAVSLTVTRLSEQFKVNTAHITTAITLTLLFRSLGALVFGLLADRFGRKWTLVGNLILICIFELGSGFCNTYRQFLAVRSLFGIAMGGIWGQAAATALENVPVAARGLCSGILQQGYAFGYLLAAVINLTVVAESKYTWRSLYFIGAGFSLAAAMVRACLPESRQDPVYMGGLYDDWIQDLFPTYLQTTKHLSAKLSTKATIISNCGAVVGGSIAGYASQYLGRRPAIIICLLYTACWIPLWIIPSSFGGLAAGGFFIQSGVQGAWGVVPIYLAEVSPPAFRALFAGLAYQLGNMASSGAAQIEADAGETLRLKGTKTPNYATIQGILIGVVIAWMLVFVTLGPEAQGSHFEQAKVAFQEGAGKVDQSELVDGAQHDERMSTGNARVENSEKN